MSAPIAALMYDFDHTLSPRDMQEYGFIPNIGWTDEEFWRACDEYKTHMDPILGYMLFMLREAQGKMLLTREVFNSLGKDVELFPGVKSWFSRVNAYGAKLGLEVRHFVISSGLKEIIEGTSIAKEFREIYAAEYHYNERGVPDWPAMAVNYTSKTQFIFRVNKGVLSPFDHDGMNTFVPYEQRPVPFPNMIFIGDGYTDIPSMRVVNEYGGCSIAVYEEGRNAVARQLLCDGRVDFAVKADYSAKAPLEEIVFAVLDTIAASARYDRVCEKNSAEALGGAKNCCE